MPGNRQPGWLHGKCECTAELSCLFEMLESDAPEQNMGVLEDNLYESSQRLTWNPHEKILFHHDKITLESEADPHVVEWRIFLQF